MKLTPLHVRMGSPRVAQRATSTAYRGFLQAWERLCVPNLDEQGGQATAHQALSTSLKKGRRGSENWGCVWWWNTEGK